MVQKIINKKDGVVTSSKWIPAPLFQTIQEKVPIPTVDLIITRKTKKGEIETLLIKRKVYPEEGKWCLIGGRILKGESVAETIKRQAYSELGLSVKIMKPWNEHVPIAVFSDPKSDKQKHFISLVYPVTIIKGTAKKEGPEFSEIQWFNIHRLPKILGFNHRKQLKPFIDFINNQSS